MNVPIGYTEEQVIQVVDEILGALASTFRFGYYEVDDLKQEGWIYALEALDNYDLSFGYNLNYFLYGHIRRRFINFKRNKSTRNESPCLSCPFYDPEFRVSDNQCGQFTNKNECEKFDAHTKRNERKRALNEVTYGGEMGENAAGIFTPNMGDALDNRTLLEKIDSYLDVSLRADFRRMVDGVSLPKAKRDKVIKAIREIVGDDYNVETT